MKAINLNIPKYELTIRSRNFIITTWHFGTLLTLQGNWERLNRHVNEIS